MSRVSECLKQILSARYGKDVRQSIHDSIQELDEVARTAQGSATLSAQTAIEKANEALTASQAAIESAKQAKAYSDNAQAVAGVTVATQDTAGLVKGGENHIGLDGTLELVVKTTEASMPNSRKGRLAVDEIGGVCVQDNIPSPDLPQEIKKSVVSVVKTHGKQFYDVGTYPITDGYYIHGGAGSNHPGEAYASTDFIPCGAWQGKTLTLNKRPGGHYPGIAFYSDKKASAYVSGVINGDLASGRPITFTVPTTAKYMRFTVLAGATEIMLNEGAEALPYEPYTEFSITLSQPIDLYNISNRQDIIEGGKVKRKYNYVVIDSNNKITPTEQTALTNTTRFSFKVPKDRGVNYKGVSSHFTYKNSYTEDSEHWYTYQSAIYFFLPREIAENIEELNEWLDAGNKIEFLYELAEEVIEDLPLADQIALNSLETFEGVTYLEFDSEVQPTFAGKYATSLVGGIALEAYNKAHTHSRTVLWTNSDKTQPIEASTVLLPLSLEAYEQYEFYLVTFCNSTASEFAEKQVLMARAAGTYNGNNVILSAVIKEGETYHQHERNLAYSFDSQAFKVAQCTYLDASFKAQYAHDKLIPYQIIGIR